MNSQERLLAAAKRQPTDRTATGLRCTAEAWQALREHLGVATNQEALDVLDIDLRWVSLPFCGPDDRSAITLASEGTDFWGCRTRQAENQFGVYYEFDYHPLAQATTVEEVENYDWPSLDWWDYAAVPAAIDQINQTGRRAVMFFAGGTFETPWYLRGMERFLMDFYENPEIVQAICTRVREYYLQRALRVLDAADGGIDVIGTGGDIGTQRGMMLSPDVWREQIKPYTCGLINDFHKMGLATFYHSCGSLVPVIDDLIEAGLDILDPIQVTATGMAPEELAPAFSRRLSFHGAIDEVELLPHATPAQVYDETSRMIKTLGQNNGYIAAPSHCVQGDTAAENVVAIFEAAKANS